MNMGERIKQLRLSKGLTQEELGEYIGVKKSAIMKYEKGFVENIKRSSILTLSEIFEVSPSYLMCFSDDPTPPYREQINLEGLSTKDIEEINKYISMYKAAKKNKDK